MTDTLKPAPPKPSPNEKPKADAPKTIAVKCLTFHQAHPALGALSSISGSTKANRSPYMIEYVPQMRHHRIEQVQGDKKPPRVLFVPEAAVASWEPAA